MKGKMNCVLKAIKNERWNRSCKTANFSTYVETDTLKEVSCHRQNLISLKMNGVHLDIS